MRLRMGSLLLLVFCGLATGIAAGVLVLGPERLLAMRGLVGADLGLGWFADLTPERRLAIGCVVAALLLFLRDAWLGWSGRRQVRKLRASVSANGISSFR